VPFVLPRGTVGILKIRTPCPEHTYIIADRNYPIDRRDMVDGMPMLEIVCIRFFDGLPTVKCSVVRHIYRVFRVERGEGNRVLLVQCLVILHSQRTNLLGYLWIDRVF